MKHTCAAPRLTACMCVQLQHQDVKVMLQSDLPLAVRKEAREKVQARLEGRIITTTHGSRVKYQFHKFTDRTALSEFPQNVTRGYAFCTLLTPPPPPPSQLG